MIDAQGGLIGAAVQAREARDVPADVIEEKCRHAKEEVEGELLAWLAGGRLAVWVDTYEGLERLSYGLYWANTDGGATSRANRVLAEGTAPSNRYPGLLGIVMVRADKFQTFAEYYLANRDLAENGVSSTTSHRLEPPLLNSGGNRYWTPLDEAVDRLTRRGIPPDRARAVLKEDIAAGELKARCRARRYDRQQARWIDIWRDLDPGWLGFIAYEFPQDNHLRFDLTAAIHARMSGEQIDLPPEHVRGIAVDAARLNQLYPPVVRRSHRSLRSVSKTRQPEMSRVLGNPSPDAHHAKNPFGPTRARSLSTGLTSTVIPSPATADRRGSRGISTPGSQTAVTQHPSQRSANTSTGGSRNTRPACRLQIRGRLGRLGRRSAPAAQSAD